MSVHSTYSLQELSGMKFCDKTSCYISGIPREFTTKSTLSSFTWFGMFGEITHIEIIRVPPQCPTEVFIKYTTEYAAICALRWCREVGLDAKHGDRAHSVPALTMDQEMEILQAQLDSLQQHYAHQQTFIHHLFSEFNALSRENHELKGKVQRVHIGRSGCQ